MDDNLYTVALEDSSINSRIHAAMDSLNSQDTDLCIITEEGEKIFTQRSLLCIYSSSLVKYLGDIPCCNSASISLPVSFIAFNNLLQVLLNGIVTANALDQLSDVAQTAKILGIKLENIDFRSENDKTNTDDSYNMIAETDPGIGQGQRKQKPRATKTKKEKTRRAENKMDEFELFANLEKFNNEEEPIIEEVKVKHEPGNGKNDEEKVNDVVSKLFKEKLTYPCDLCGKKFPSNSKLNRHMTTHAREKLLQENDGLNQAKFMKTKKTKLSKKAKIPKEKPTRTCEFCGRMFLGSFLLNRHMTTHTGVKSYACDQCQNSFTRQDKLSRHMTTHTGEKPYACDQCPKSFTRQDKMKLHQSKHQQVTLTNLHSSNDEPIHDKPIQYFNSPLQINL